MVTAWSPSGAPRFRLPAGPRRLLLAAVLLFGLVYAHGFNAEGVSSHLTPTPATAASAAAGAHDPGGEPGTVVQAVRTGSAEADPHQDDDHGTSHPAHECLPGQPQQGPAPGAQTVCSWTGGTAFSDQRFDAPSWSEGASAVVGLRDSTGSRVLRR